MNICREIILLLVGFLLTASTQAAPQAVAAEGHELSAGVSFFLPVGSPVYGVGQAEADPEKTQKGVDSGKKSLKRGAKFPWYDGSNDELKRIDVESSEDKDTVRSSNWQTPASAPSTPSNFGSSFLDTLIRVLFYAIIGLILTFVIIFLVRAFMKVEAKKVMVSNPSAEEDEVGDAARVENLPFKMLPPKGDLFSEAERLYREGNYDAAIIYLFSYELVELDKHQIIRLTRGKTNRQYQREVRTQQEIRSILSRTILAFEDVFFGHHSLGRERFEACWQEVQVFQQILGREAEVTV